jgi:pilus assembly protein CpaB
VSEGESLDRAALETRDWPTGTVPAGAFTSVDSVVGRVARVAVFKGEAIVPGRLAPAGTGAGLEVKITPGKRAMALRIDDVAGLSGLVQPNSRVDVLVTLREGGSRSSQVAKLFMENMRVLSVGTQLQRGNDGRPINATTATIEVTPEEAERLAVAMSQGSIQLVLRGYGDPDAVNTSGATSSEVLSSLRAYELPKPPTPRPTRVVPRATPQARDTVVVQLPPKRPDSATVQIFRAGKATEQKIAKTDSSSPGEGRAP